MKIIVALLILCVQVQAVTRAQTVSIHVENGNLKEVFREIRKQTEVSFLYKESDLQGSKSVTVSMKNKPLSEVLDRCFADQPVTYKIEKNFVVVKKKDNVALKPVQQQQIAVTGTVKDENGEALPAVSIVVKGTQAMVVSDTHGHYKINVPNNEATLVFSFLGYSTQEIWVGNERVIDVKLEQSVSELEQVVVNIGYGEVKRKDLTGAVAQVNMEELQKAPVSSFEEALAGRIAGVNVSSNDGQPGSEMNIVIRGGNSLTQSNAPLYVIDGFPSEDAVGSMVSPNDIASITVLKDASATAIYGSRAANGVILIETKKAKIGNSVIDYNLSSGIQKVTKRMELMSGYDFVKYQLELDEAYNTEVYLDRPNRTLDDYRNIEAIDWQDMLFRNSKLNIHDISISGGNANAKYRLSGSVYDQDGIIVNTGYDRYNGRIFVEQSFSKDVKLTANVNINRQKTFGEQINETKDNYASNIMYAIWGYRPVGTGMDDLEYALVDELSNDLRVNPYINAQNTLREVRQNNTWANIRFDYKILPKLELRVSGVYNNKIFFTEGFSNSKTSGGYPFPNNVEGMKGHVDNWYRTHYVNENILTFRPGIKNGHRYDVMGGFIMQYNIDRRNGYSSKLIPYEELGVSGIDLGEIRSMNSFISDNALVSFIGRANYNYKSKYLATVSLRADGSSKFAPQNRWGYFPSGSVAWDMSQEDFLKNIDKISTSKIRVSYGITGNNRVSDYPYMTSMTYNIPSYYSFGDQTPGPGMIISNLGNYDLKWESTYQLDVGYDLSMFRNRLNFTFDYYQKRTIDLLLNARLPTSTGFNTTFKNIGKVKNEGLEFALHTVNVQTNRFEWSSDFNIAFNRNKILALAEDQTFVESSVLFPRRLDRQPLYLAEIGGAATAFYGYEWLGNYQVEDFDLENGRYVLKDDVAANGNARQNIQPGDIKYQDTNGDLNVNLQDRVILGNALPKHIGGWNNTLRFDRFTASIFLQWAYGHKIFNANRMIFEGNFYNILNLNQYIAYEDRWTPENPNNEYFRTGGFGPRGMMSSRTIEDGSYLRVKTVSLSYDFPDYMLSKIKIKGFSINATAQNLFTWTKYSGMDPEVSIQSTPLTQGLDYLGFPRAKSFVLGLKLKI